MSETTVREWVASRVGSRMPTRSWRALAMLLGVLLGGGCSLDGLLKSDEVPPDVNDPAVTNTPMGALAASRGALVFFQKAFGDNRGVVAITGLLTDELYDNAAGAGADQRGVDIRSLSEDDPELSALYSALQKVRGQAGQAIGLLMAYVPEQPARAGELYALVGYAEVFLADVFCSGIPLSTLDYNGDYTYRPGSTTDEVYAHAEALFDSALTLAGDSVRVAQLAQLGRARALLARGQYGAAATAAVSIPTEYQYDVKFNTASYAVGGVPASARNFATTSDGTLTGTWDKSVADHEGGRGLDYVSSDDPRTPVVSGGGGSYSHPSRYASEGSSPIVLASGVEARLIEAEAALRDHPDDGQWLATLNALRTNGTQDGAGVYQPGFSGGYAGLAPLDDPGAALTGAAAHSARVDLLFRERAFWLFLTGHRQGDLRRLVRQYLRSQSAVYPSGAYRTGSFQYGSDVAAPIPREERIANPLFTGCASTGA